MWDILAIPFSWLMKGCLFIAGSNYLIALLFFALAIQIILLPLAIKQQKSQIQMAKIKPKEMAIREKYKGRNDRTTQQKMTMEIQEMYQKEGYNQFAGCLPLLIQLPIILVLFAIVRSPITHTTDFGDKNFVLENSKTAVTYYQEVKENLVADKFSGNEYSETVSLIDNYQTNLGGVEGEKNGNLKVFNPTISNEPFTYADLTLAHLIIDGREEINELIEGGKLDSAFIAKYEALGLEQYKDKMPNYRVGENMNLLNEPDFGRNLWLMLIPLLVFLTSFFQTKLTRKMSPAQLDANGNPIGGGLFMEVGMPLISAMFAYSISAAVGVYWVWRTLLAMVQTVVLAKTMPVPVVTEEQLNEARRELKTKQKKKKVITIEVDEDDDSYNDIMVGGAKQSSNNNSSDPTKRTPRTIEMLSSDDED